MERTFCQSCGMPMGSGDCGSYLDGTVNPDYCHYCFNEGAFTSDLTMEEMIRECAAFSDSFRDAEGNPLSLEQAIEQMRTWFPRLKRWSGV